MNVSDSEKGTQCVNSESWELSELTLSSLRSWKTWVYLNLYSYLFPHHIQRVGAPSSSKMTQLIVALAAPAIQNCSLTIFLLVSLFHWPRSFLTRVHPGLFPLPASALAWLLLFPYLYTFFMFPEDRIMPVHQPLLETLASICSTSSSPITLWSITEQLPSPPLHWNCSTLVLLTHQDPNQV